VSNSSPQIPSNLIIARDAIISVDLQTPLGFYPREDYLLIELTGRIKIWDTRKLIAKYSRNHPTEPIVIRSIGRSINTAAIMIHLMQTEEQLYSTNLNAQTFSAQNPNSNKPLTGVQFILFPRRVMDE